MFFLLYVPISPLCFSCRTDLYDMDSSAPSFGLRSNHARYLHPKRWMLASPCTFPFTLHLTSLLAPAGVCGSPRVFLLLGTAAWPVIPRPSFHALSIVTKLFSPFPHPQSVHDSISGTPICPGYISCFSAIPILMTYDTHPHYNYISPPNTSIIIDLATLLAPTSIALAYHPSLGHVLVPFLTLYSFIYLLISVFVAPLPRDNCRSATSGFANPCDETLVPQPYLWLRNLTRPTKLSI